MPKKKLRIAIGSDHNGFIQKNFLIDSLRDIFNIIDIGPYEHTKVDYPDISYQLSKLIENKHIDKGILICGTGVGMSISCLLYTSPSPRDGLLSRMPSSA